MRLCLLILLAACGKDRDRRPDSTGVPTGGTTVGTGGTAADLLVEESGVRLCPFPGARTNGYYDRRTAPHAPADGAYTWGGGRISADFSGDGTLDVVAASQAGPQLFVTVPGSPPEGYTFVEAFQAFAGIEADYAVGGTAADLDVDGDLDLVLTRWERPNLLLRNDGDHFEDATPTAWRLRAHKTQSASLADVDGDGDLDVFFGNYGETPDTYNMPDMPPGDPDELYRNDGGGVWTDLSDRLPAEVHDGYAFASGWWQLSGDALPELVVAHDFGKVRPTVLVRNLGDFTFEADTTFHPGWEDMGMGVADVNGDALPDLLFSSWKIVSVLASSADYPGLWFEANNAWGIQADVENRSQVYGWGAEWGDLDNDTDQDAMVLFGYWATYDEAGDPLTQIDALYVQTGPLAFEQLGGDPMWQVNDGSRGRGLVFADLNDDGYLDVLKGLPESGTVMYLSRCGGDNSLVVRLRDVTSANTHAIGATVRATAGGVTQTRWIHAGSSGMYGGAPPEAHFGLGSLTAVDTLEVVWPDGRTDRLSDLTAQQRVTITRGVPSGP